MTIIVERVVEGDGRISLWSVDDTAKQTAEARKFLGYEQPVRRPASSHSEAICWSYGRTLGNVSIFDEQLIASLPGLKGSDEIIGCDLVDAGRMRNGAKRWWCRTHQVHWGAKADIEVAHARDELRCSNASQPMSFVVNPTNIALSDHAEVGVWCSMPPALTSAGVIKPRRPRIHVHVREVVAGTKIIDGDFETLRLQYPASGSLFAETDQNTVYVTPPAALEFVTALEAGRDMGCVACQNCGAAHLDLGEFARSAHSKHLCGNCGRDSVWTDRPMISTPLKPLHDRYSADPPYLDVNRVLNIDDYSGATFAIWASTPAVVWTSHRPQERGIHVHLNVGDERKIDDTFGTVIYRGEQLRRVDLLAVMIAHTLI